MTMKHFFSTLIFVFVLHACGSDDKSSDHASPKPNGGRPATSTPELTTENPFDFDRAVVVKSNHGIYEVHLNWKKNPVAGMDKHNVADVVFKASSGETKELVLGKFQPKMNCCGTKPVQSQKIKKFAGQVGRLEISDVYFHAAGAQNGWTLLIDAKVNGKEDRAEMIIEKILPSK